MWTYLALVATFLALSSAHIPVTRRYELNVASELVSPDGFERVAVTMNGRLKGPLLTANKHDKFEVKVKNRLTSKDIHATTTVHWHGILQRRNSAADGVDMVTQCPISPGLSYTYAFTPEEQTGTYWYHSHVETQYCDGLRGPLIIYDPNDPHRKLYDVDNELTVVTLDDWYHLPSEQAFANKSIIQPRFDSILVNGRGRYVGGPKVPLTTLDVKKGLRYRYRLINSACSASFNITIDNHSFTVIEVDGVPHKPITVDQLTIFPGQRYSIVVKADQRVGNYWFRTSPTPPPLNAGPPDPSLSSAILRYRGAPAEEPNTTALVYPNYKALQERNLIPLENPGSLTRGPADLVVHITPGLNVSSGIWTMNNASYTSPPLPILLQILSGKVSAKDVLPKGLVYTLPPNKIIEVNITDPIATFERAHPFHLHGHTFDVISSFNSTPNYKNPPRRDVVAVGGGGVVFRFKTDNSGPWIFHCHNDFHFNSGMAVVFVEDPKGIKKGENGTKVSPEFDELCKAYDRLADDDDDDSQARWD